MVDCIGLVNIVIMYGVVIVALLVGWVYWIVLVNIITIYGWLVGYL